MDYYRPERNCTCCKFIQENVLCCKQTQENGTCDIFSQDKVCLLNCKLALTKCISCKWTEGKVCLLHIELSEEVCLQEIYPRKGSLSIKKRPETECPCGKFCQRGFFIKWPKKVQEQETGAYYCKMRPKIVSTRKRACGDLWQSSLLPWEIPRPRPRQRGCPEDKKTFSHQSSHFLKRGRFLSLE